MWLGLNFRYLKNIHSLIKFLSRKLRKWRQKSEKWDLSYFRVFFIWKAFHPKVCSVFWSNKLDTEIFIDSDRSISLNRDNAFA